jgi:prephenate dehydrogenase
MAQIGVVGLGLIGGSLAAALKARGRHRIVGLTRSPSTALEARRRKLVHEASTQPSVLRDCDIVVLCVPVQSTFGVVKKISGHLKKGAILTDAGSVKESVERDVRKALGSRRDVFFVGAHPIAGSEKSGLRFADKSLFKNSICVVTSSGPASRPVAALWSSVGAKTLRLSPRDHDRFLAATSHLPHILAFALYAEVLKLKWKNPAIRSLVAGSFRDMTRIAASNADVWTGILESNSSALREAWRVFQWNAGMLLRKRGKSLQRTLAFLSSSRQKWTSL